MKPVRRITVLGKEQRREVKQRIPEETLTSRKNKKNITTKSEQRHQSVFKESDRPAGTSAFTRMYTCVIACTRCRYTVSLLCI